MSIASLTPRLVRQGIRLVFGSKVFVRRIARRMFFGFESVKYGDFWISVSDVEKTLIDLVYFNQPIDAGVVSEAKKNIDEEKLRVYLKKCSPRVEKRVLELLACKKVKK